jgi:hypothetical protein
MADYAGYYPPPQEAFANMCGAIPILTKKHFFLVIMILAVK